MWTEVEPRRRQAFLETVARFVQCVVVSSSGHPTNDELALVGHLGRLRRLAKEGLSAEEIVAQLTSPESSESYVARNQTAMAELEQRILSPEYFEKVAGILALSDPVARAAAQSALKLEMFATLDMEAVHRTIAARNRQLVSEGVLPPDQVP